MFVCSPAIIHTNGYNILQTVRRIIPNTGQIQYYGAVHEEPRTIKDNTSCYFIAFDNVILHHDGYSPEIIKEKNKLKRNTILLEKMLEENPTNPKLLYFYSRDAQSFISKKMYEEMLLNVIKYSDSTDSFHQFKSKAYNDLIDFYVRNQQIDSAKETLAKWKKMVNKYSDMLFWEITLEMIEIEHLYRKMIAEIIDYKRNHSEVEYGTINSNGFHLDFLLSRLLFNVHDYDKACSISNKLSDVNYDNHNNKLRQIRNTINKYIE